jgi:5'-deoxynucleotidase YfbR-like HD superfamily hydrolase
MRIIWREFSMLDEKRILSKIDELDSYLKELEEIMPKNYEEYVNSIEKRGHVKGYFTSQ